METKYTQGPLKVVPDDKWPFDLVTYDMEGRECFRTILSAHSTHMKSFDDALSGVGFTEEVGEFSKQHCIDANIKAYNNEVLRAAAPGLLSACISALKDVQAINKMLIANGHHGYVLMETELDEVIKKATL